jgi:hypothetical protein
MIAHADMGDHAGEVVWHLEGRVVDSDRSGIAVPFGIGSRFVLVAQYDAVLQMEMFDWNHADNAGALAVNIQRIGTAPDAAIDQ